MSSTASHRVSVVADAKFWELYIASILLLRYRWRFLLVLSVFPLAGLFLLLTPLMGYRLSIIEISLAFVGFLYIPFIIALSVWLTRRRNKLTHGPLTYFFDADGMHTTGAAIEQTIRWMAIPRIRCTRKFLFIFIGTGRAYCIPQRAITDPEFFNGLKNIAAGKTDFGPCVEHRTISEVSAN